MPPRPKSLPIATDIDMLKKRIFDKYEKEYFEREVSKPKKFIPKLANKMRQFVFDRFSDQGRKTSALEYLGAVGAVGIIIFAPHTISMLTAATLVAGGMTAIVSDMSMRLVSDYKVNRDIENQILIDRYMKEEVSPALEGSAKEFSKVWVFVLKEHFSKEASFLQKQRVPSPKQSLKQSSKKSPKPSSPRKPEK